MAAGSLSGRVRAAILAVLTVATVSAATPALAVSCAGLAEWSCSTSYGLGASVRFNGSKYTLCSACSRAASCPGFTPEADNWWTNNGVCDGGTSPTPTPTPTTAPGNPTPTPSPTPTTGPGPTATPTPTPVPGGDVEVTPGSGAVSASANDGNLPGNTVDNSLSTRWSANGDGHWIKYDLGTTRTVTRVRIGFFSGNVRQSRFDLQTSTDNVNWSNALTGQLSSGTSTQQQNFDFADRSARYVRYLGHGNTVNSWNSILEFDIHATSGGGVPTPTPTPTTPGPTPTPQPTATPNQPTPTPCGSGCGGGLPANLITGYWHNFNNGSTTMKLNAIPSKYNLIAVAFADASGAPGAVTFNLDPATGYTDVNEFKSHISSINSGSRKVIISVGGQNGTVSINDSTSATNFRNSIVSLMNNYGFAGVDIDLENGLNATFMEQALRGIRSQKPGAIITMAPQTIDMQGGQQNGNGYFRLALNIRDILTVVNMQYYNSGSMLGCDGQVYSQGTINFLTALACVQLQAGLAPSQVGLGVPASTSGAGGGFYSPTVVNNAMRCLESRTSCGSFVPPQSWPGIRGAMTWSINWDAVQGYSWVNGISVP
jgi:chitinase